MILRSLFPATLLLALPLLAAAPPAQKAASKAVSKPATVTISAGGGHILGNPKARHGLIEYASYTCPHCAVFEAEGGGPIAADYVRRGLISFELRNLIRDPVDLSAALLARCGPPSRFFDNHRLIMRNQSVWLSAAQSTTVETRKTWFEGTYPERLTRIAKDTGLYTLMRAQGFAAAQLDACLADAKSLDAVTKMSDAGAKMGVDGTPTFFLDGKKLNDVYGWAALKPLLPTVNPKS